MSAERDIQQVARTKNMAVRNGWPVAPFYLVQVRDEKGDLSDEESFSIGCWPEISGWLAARDFMAEGFVVEIRVCGDLSI